MPFDAHKNFAYSMVAVPPSPATSGLSLEVLPGDGPNFPEVPFNAVIKPNFCDPSNNNAEIVRVTNIVTDTLTFIRLQEGTSARAILLGDWIGAVITNKTLIDIEDAIDALTSSIIIRDVSPEGVDSAGYGVFCWDKTHKALYIKDSASGNTGWQELIAAG